MPKSTVILLCGLAAVSAIAPLGCWVPEEEPTEDGGSGGPDKDEDRGIPVRCCYQASLWNPGDAESFPDTFVPVCQMGHKECWDLLNDDADGNGKPSSNEMGDLCREKLKDWPAVGMPKESLGLELPDWADLHQQEVWFSDRTHVYRMEPVYRDDLDDEENPWTCDPEPVVPFHNAPSKVVVPPTHDVTFAATPGAPNSGRLRVLEQETTVRVQGLASLALFRCDTKGVNGGICNLNFHELDLELAQPFDLNGYKVDQAKVSLADITHSEVFFDACQANTCVGHFEFSAQSDNAARARIRWTQRNLSTGKVGRGKVSLDDPNDGLGEDVVVAGTLLVSRDGTLQSIEVVGQDLSDPNSKPVTADFDLRGSVRALPGALEALRQ